MCIIRENGRKESDLETYRRVFCRILSLGYSSRTTIRE